jgi:DNA primase
MDEFKRHCKDPGFKAEQFFKFHPDRTVSALAIEMIADKYELGAPKEDARLGELVTQLLYEMKLTVINMQIAELEAGLKEAQEKNDVDRQRVLLTHHPQLLAQRNEICKRLGNRIINL